MARYTDPVCRICRREGTKLFLKGTRCYSKKCAFERRQAPPGQHGIRRRKVGEYGMQLREKQKIRRVYSVLERQFKGYFEKASATQGVTGENLLRMLELRMDNAARIQAANLLRTVGGDRAVLSSLSLAYRPAAWRRTTFTLQADNLWNSNFQEVPAVPAWVSRSISAPFSSRAAQAISSELVPAV